MHKHTLLTLVTAVLAGGALALPVARFIERRRYDYREIEALIGLYRLIDPVLPLPPMRGWVISPDFALLLAGQVRGKQRILELGSGTSTLISAYVMCAQGGGRIISLEHQPAFAQATRDLLAQHNLSPYAEVIDTPLTDYQLGGKRWRWYDLSCVGALRDVDLLTIDGPSQHNNLIPMIRYPALPLLWETLQSGAHILLDDAKRRDEQRIIDVWKRDFALEELPMPDTEKGAALLVKRG